MFFGSDLKLKSAVLSMQVDLLSLLGYDTVDTMDKLLEVIRQVDAMSFCHGAGGAAELCTVTTKIAFIDLRGKWRSKKCHKLLPMSSGMYCSECTRLRNQALRNMRLRKIKGSPNKVKTPESPRSQKLVNKLRNRIKSEQRSKNRHKLRICLLNKKIEHM